MSSQPPTLCSKGLKQNDLDQDGGFNDEINRDHEKSADGSPGIDEGDGDDDEVEEKPTPRRSAYELMRRTPRQRDKAKQGKKTKLNLRADDLNTKISKYFTAHHKKTKYSQEGGEEQIGTQDETEKRSADLTFIPKKVAQSEECPVEQVDISNHVPPMQANLMIPSQIWSLHDETTSERVENLTEELTGPIQSSQSDETLIRMAMFITAEEERSYAASLPLLRTLLFRLLCIQKIERYGESRNTILGNIVREEVSRLRADGVGLSQDEHQQMMAQDRTEASTNLALPDDSSTMPFEVRNLDPSTSDPYRRDMISRLDMGLRVLVKAVMQDFRSEQNKFVEKVGNEHIMRDLWKIFASTNRHVLKGIIQGDLCKAYHDDPHTQRDIDELRERARTFHQPVIYLGTVANRLGNPHSVGQVRKIFQVAKEYLQVNKYTSRDHLHQARNIDEGINSGAIFESYEDSDLDEPSSEDTGWQVSRQSSQYLGAIDPLREYRNGYRKLLFSEDGEKRTGPIKCRVEALQYCISAIERRIKVSNQNPHDLFSPPFFDIGYSADFESRSKKHKSKTDNSHMILKLFLAISKLLYGRQYGLQQFVVYLIWEKAQASVGEKAFTYLANGMIKRGG